MNDDIIFIFLYFLKNLSAIDKFIKDKTQQPDLALIELRIQEILKVDKKKFNHCEKKYLI